MRAEVKNFDDYREINCLDLNLSFLTYKLCDLGQVT